MDIVTQGLLGAVVAQSVARREQQRIAALIGGLSGLLADADILIRSSTDPLLTLEFHRHFSHALLFVPIGALIAALPLWWLLRRRIGFGATYLFAFAGYSLSGVLDAFTSYGTQLFWPLSDARIALNLIAVVDPVFSLALLLALVTAAVRRSPLAARLGLLFAAGYLLLAGVQQHRAETVAIQLAAGRNHPVERLLVKPTLGNLLLWRVVYQSEGRFHVAAVRVGLGEAVIYPGASLPRLLPERDLPGLRRDTETFRDIQRFAHFSDDYLARHPQQPLVIGDVRYSMSPDGVVPLWGIGFDPARQDQHVSYRFFRDSSAADRARSWAMLMGRPVDGGNADGR